MAKYRKRPVIVEAWPWDQKAETLKLLQAEGMRSECEPPSAEDPDTCLGLKILTLEGPLHVSGGDLIIKGVAGEFYSCKPEIFAATYESAEDGTGVCTWAESADGVWTSDCGLTWEFSLGGPVDNQMMYCPKCGRPLVAQPYMEKEPEE
jgi:hypothetical protein